MPIATPAVSTTPSPKPTFLSVAHTRVPRFQQNSHVFSHHRVHTAAAIRLHRHVHQSHRAPLGRNRFAHRIRGESAPSHDSRSQPCEARKPGSVTARSIRPRPQGRCRQQSRPHRRRRSSPCHLLVLPPAARADRRRGLEEPRRDLHRDSRTRFGCLRKNSRHTDRSHGGEELRTRSIVHDVVVPRHDEPHHPAGRRRQCRTAGSRFDSPTSSHSPIVAITTAIDAATIP